MLVQANNLKEAYDNIEKSMSGMVSDYEIPAIQESPIMDVFPYFSKEEATTEEAIQVEERTEEIA